MRRTKRVQKGDWRTLEWFFNANGSAFFDAPAGAQIKVRYGVSIFGTDRQKQTLDGRTIKRLAVGGFSIVRARMQIKVSQTADVTYLIFPDILDSPPPEI